MFFLALLILSYSEKHNKGFINGWDHSLCPALHALTAYIMPYLASVYIHSSNYFLLIMQILTLHSPSSSFCFPSFYFLPPAPAFLSIHLFFSFSSIWNSWLQHSLPPRSETKNDMSSATCYFLWICYCKCEGCGLSWMKRKYWICFISLSCC